MIYYHDLPAGFYHIVINLANNNGTMTPFHGVTNFEILPPPGQSGAPSSASRERSPAPGPRRHSNSSQANTSLCIVRRMGNFRRLMGFLRPYRRELWGSMVFAWLAIGMTVLIPVLIGRAVNAIEHGEKSDLLPLALAIVGASVLRLGLTVVRAGRRASVSLGGRVRPAQLMYAHLQRLELGSTTASRPGS